MCRRNRSSHDLRDSSSLAEGASPALDEPPPQRRGSGGALSYRDRRSEARPVTAANEHQRGARRVPSNLGGDRLELGSLRPQLGAATVPPSCSPPWSAGTRPRLTGSTGTPLVSTPAREAGAREAHLLGVTSRAAGLRS